MNRSWFDDSGNPDFSIHNIPFGVGSYDGRTQVMSAIGDRAILLGDLYDDGILNVEGLEKFHLDNESLNDFITAGKSVTSAVRNRIIELLCEESQLHRNQDKYLVPQSEVTMLMPVEVGDYTDFYSSREHATNVGKMFRDPENALLPNWLHIPVGYHGRASSIVVSGTDIHRPKGQILPAGADSPIYDACKLLDFELEMAFIIGKENPLGQPISIEEADDYIFGMVLFNDWSARDIQKWEYVPLGPFLGKNFASTVSPWVVTMEALEPFRITGPEQNPTPLPYLKQSGKNYIDLNLEMIIKGEAGWEQSVCKSNFKYMYWSMHQQLAHHTVNGCNMRVGDMCASGTISGPERESFGSMLELSWRGTNPLPMPDESERKFIQDGDTVIMKGYAEKDGVRVGFGEAAGKILPAL